MKTNIFFSFLTLAGFLFSCQKISLKTTPPSNVDISLKTSMSHLKYELDELLPYLANPKEFHNPINKAKIEEKIHSLQKLGSQVTHEPAIKQKDPILEFLSIGFQDEINRSYQAYKQNHQEFARVSLLNVSAYCIECHTRTQSGPSFSTSSVDKIWSKMRALDQIDYLVATRQFELARTKINQIAGKGLSAEINVFDLDRAIRLGLLITVRYQQNPQHASLLVDQILKAPQLPFYLKSAAQAWKKQVNSWIAENKKSNTQDPLVFARELFKRSQVEKTDERFFEVDLFRVQTLLNPLIATETNSQRLGEALWILGQSYELTKDLVIWSLHETYFESCIQKLPHTIWSNKCYNSLEKSIYTGYTGSRGTYLPPDVEEKLKALKKLSVVK